MSELIVTFLLAIWLYFGSFLVASPSFAVVTSPQNADKLETVDSHDSEAELALKNLSISRYSFLYGDSHPH
jgi:hypothetical protein